MQKCRGMLEEVESKTTQLTESICTRLVCVLANDFSLAANPSNTLNPYFMASLKAEIYLLKNVVSKKSPKKCVYILKLCIRISAAI
jgi:hypothetical protein